MKKILIIGFSKIKYMPYFNFYYDNIDKDIFDIDVVYWNRDGKNEDLTHYKDCSFFSYNGIMSDNSPKLHKVKHFLKFRKFEKQVLKKSDYDYVICLHTFPGMLINHFLVKHYYKRFIFDYRDSTYEKIKFFQNKIIELSSSSLFTFVSSDGFRKYLPKDTNVITTHNILIDSLNYRQKNHQTTNVVRLSYWGFIRDEKTNIAIIDKIAADARFELHYYGKEQEIALSLKKHVVENDIKNVFFHGEYSPKDRYDFMKNTDLLHNVFLDDNMMIAMGNKYYDGIIFYIPLLCSQDSFMGKRATNAGVGFECNPYDTDFTEKIYQYYSNLNKEQFWEKCDIELKTVLNEYDKGAEIIKGLK